MKKLMLVALMGLSSTFLWAQSPAPAPTAESRAAQQLQQIDRVVDLSDAQKEVLAEKLKTQAVVQFEKREAMKQLKQELEASRAEQQQLILEVLDEQQQQQYIQHQARKKERMQTKRTSKGKAR